MFSIQFYQGEIPENAKFSPRGEPLYVLSSSERGTKSSEDDFDNSDIRPICLPPKNAGDFVGDVATVIGWGALKEGYSFHYFILASNILYFFDSVMYHYYFCKYLFPAMTVTFYGLHG